MKTIAEATEFGRGLSLLTWLGKTVFLEDNPNPYRVAGVNGQYLFLQPCYQNDRTIVRREPSEVILAEEEVVEEGVR